MKMPVTAAIRTLLGHHLTVTVMSNSFRVPLDVRATNASLCVPAGSETEVFMVLLFATENSFVLPFHNSKR